jgi:2-polyprenylphenol 6-hydroxylase
MISNNRLDAEIIIAGGGLAGLTLASLLANHGIRCLVIDEREQPLNIDNIDPRTLAVTRASENILKAAGAWQLLPPDRVGYFRKMFVWDEHGYGDITFDCAEFCEPTLGYIIEQTVLEWALQQIVNNSGLIECYRPSRVDTFDITDQTAIIRLADGQELTAKILVGADGIKSAIRARAGIDYPLYDYRQTAVACIVDTEKPHEMIARQRFLANGPLAFLPMADSFQCGVVWTTAPDFAKQLLAMDENNFNLELASNFSFSLGNIINSKSRTGFPLQHAQAEHYCQSRIALAGDAAHCVHPLAGQGANLGLLDAAALAEVISGAYQQNKDPGNYSVLRKYERWRKGDNFMMLRILQGFKLLFENRRGSIRLLRNVGMDLTDMLLPVKHSLSNYATGLSGDLPSAARFQ